MKKNTNWITLIELTVVIAIFWIIIVWLSRINYNTNINKQKFEDFNNQIVTNIEAVRNNAINWKWVLSWTTLINPNKFNINLNLNNMTSWYDSSYNNLSNETNVSFSNLNKILSIKCTNINWSIPTDTNPTINNLNLNFTSNSILTNCWNINNSVWKIIIIKTISWDFKKTIKFNTVTWIVSKENQ